MNSKVRRQKLIAAVAPFISTFFLLPSSFAQTNQPAAAASAVMVNSNGVVIAPANFAAANGFGTNNGAPGLATNLAPAKIYIGNALSNAAAQTVSGDVSLATNGTVTLAATGTAGTYAQVATDAKGRVTSGAATLPVNAGGTGQTSAAAALSALGGASLTASNNFTAGQNFGGALRFHSLDAPNGLSSALLVFDDAGGGGDQTLNVTGSPGSSGPGLTFDILGTNFDSTLSKNANGYSILDQVSLVGVGATSLYNDFPAALLFVSPKTQMIFGNNNAPRLVIAGQGASFGHIGVPYIGSSTNVFPYPETLKNNTTNIYVQPADLPLLWDADTINGTFSFNSVPGGVSLANGTVLKTTNGTLVKGNGTLNNSSAFDPADAGTVHHDSAIVYATNFVATARNNISVTAFDAAGNGSGVSYQVGPGSVSQTLLQAHGSTPIILIGNNQGWIGTYNSVLVGGLESEITNTSFAGENNNAILQIMGSIGLKVIGKSANYGLSVDDEVVLLTVGGITATLPDAASHCAGRIYTLKNKASSSCTVATTASETIDGSTTYILTNQNQFISVQSDGTNWNVIGH